jgi:hypothetical protein
VVITHHTCIKDDGGTPNRKCYACEEEAAAENAAMKLRTKTTSDAQAQDLQLVLDAARQHAGNDQHWRGVSAPAYFAANLGRDENRRKLWDAISRVNRKPESPWKPISTIPEDLKDGRWLLLRGESGYINRPYRAHVAHWDAEYRPHNPWQTSEGGAFEDDGGPPTHYMELP